MKSHDPSKFTVGQSLIYLVGKVKLPVTFLSYGPRMGKVANDETITIDPQTAIVRDENGSFLTVGVLDLQVAPKTK